MAANHLIVALFPIDPLVPFVKIKLAAFATFVQRVRQAAAVLVEFHLFKNSENLQLMRSGCSHKMHWVGLRKFTISIGSGSVNGNPPEMR